MNRKKRLKYFSLFLIFCFLIVVIICFFAMRKLVFPVDCVMADGKLFSEFASQKRTELLKNDNVKVVSINTKDGIKLSGFFIKRTKATGNLLLCHGYQSCKESMIDYIDMFPEYNILLFDFRAHGQSEGKYRTLGCHEYKDVIAASEFLREQTKFPGASFNNLPQIILGFSMGGAAALVAAGFDPNICDVLILDSAFANLEDVIRYAFKLKAGLPYYPFLPVLKHMVNFWAGCDIDKMCPIASLKTFSKPVFFIHSCVDKVVSPKDTLLMYASASGLKTKLWIGPKVAHGGLRKDFASLYKKKVSKFIRTSLA